MHPRRPKEPPEAGRRPSTWAGYAACTWASAFAALSFYWAAGGTIGLETLSRDIRQSATTRSSGFVAVLWATAALKVGAGVLALALVQPWGARVPRRVLLVAGWATGALLALYGALGLVSAALAEAGFGESTDPATVHWYLFLWEPYWLVGGLLFLAATWQFSRRSSGRRGVR